MTFRLKYKWLSSTGLSYQTNFAKESTDDRRPSKSPGSPGLLKEGFIPARDRRSNIEEVKFIKKIYSIKR